MTSPLRRKHRTTALKSRPRTATKARRSSFWQILLDHVSRSCRLGLLAGIAATSCCSIAWADDFRHAGRLGRVEPARIRFSDDAKPLNPARDDLGSPPSDTEEETSAADLPSPAKTMSADQSTAWRLRWRQPQAATGATQAAPVVNRSTIAKPKLKMLSASRAVLVWNDSQTTEPSHVRQVAQFAPVDPFNDPFGDESKNKVVNPAPLDTIEISQPGQSPGAGAKPSALGGGQPGGLNASPFPGMQLQGGDSRLIPGGNRPIPRSDLPNPTTDSPFPAEELPNAADDRPTTGDDRPTQPGAPVPGDTQPKLPDFLPDFTDPAPQPKDSVDPSMPETPETPGQPNGTTDEDQPRCDRMYNERNCCTEGNNCMKARQRVYADKISNILLDISPLFTNTDQKLSTEAHMATTLAKAPSHTWIDRDGKELARGRIQDFRHGRVHVTTDSGEVIKIPYQHLSDDDVCFFTAWWSLPTECPIGDMPFQPRNWLCANLDWKASGLCHKPLYFEEVALERYGHSTGPFTQPFISTAHFFGSLVSLPYQMGMHPPQECQYVLGHYRPGNCAPWLVPPFPVSLRGGLAEAGAVIGGIYLFP